MPSGPPPTLTALETLKLAWKECGLAAVANQQVTQESVSRQRAAGWLGRPEHELRGGVGTGGLDSICFPVAFCKASSRLLEKQCQCPEAARGTSQPLGDVAEAEPGSWPLCVELAADLGRVVRPTQTELSGAAGPSCSFEAGQVHEALALGP